MLDGFVGWVVPFEVVVAVGEVDVFFVEDGGPLEGCGYNISISSRSVQTMSNQTCRIGCGRS